MTIACRTKMLASAAVAALVLGGTALVSVAPARAQVEFRFGSPSEYGSQGYGATEPYGRRYRRERRVVVEEDEPECRIIVRRRINRFGEAVEIRKRVCS